MPKLFPYPTATDVAEAAGEVISRIRSGALGQNLALDANQLTGIASFIPKLVLGDPSESPKPLIGSITLSDLPEVTLDEAENHLNVFRNSGGFHGAAGSSISNQALLASLVAVLRFAAPLIPPPYGATILAILTAMGF